MIDISGENVVLVGALLLFVAVIAGKVAYRFGAPALLLFLGVGMLFGLNFISFRSVEMTQFVGMIALCIILFTGGMDTKFSEIKPIIGPGVVLATAGVVMTAFILASFVWLVAPWLGIEMPFVLALLLASTMSSTDSASVFSILRSKKQGLKQNLRPLLELESGSNDPMAYMMTILLISVVSHSSGSVGMGMSVVFFVVQMIVGALSGYLIGRLAVWTINRINLANHSLYSVLLLAFIFFSFAFTDLIKGNGYLAVYLSGLVVGNYKLQQKRPLTVFFDGFTWLMQIVMFLTLGLFVNSDELLEPRVLILGGLVGAFMILVARPLTVFICMAPFRKFTAKARLYVSWVGLRGAVPILFAIYPLMAHVENAGLLFNVVFLGTIISLLVQGTTVSGMANLLGLAYEERESAFSVDMHQDMKSALTEVEVNETMLESGHWLQSAVYTSMLDFAASVHRMADLAGKRPQLGCEYITAASLTGMDLASGSVSITAAVAPDIFYKILGEQTGLDIVDEASLLPCVVSLARAKRAYDKIKSALDQVEATGYGIVMPGIDELTLEEPEIVRQGGQYGVRLSASAPSLHIMRANIHTELSPTVGSEQQGEELIKSLLADFETDPGKLWSTNIFGKSLNELVSEGVQAKLLHMPQELSLIHI